MLPSVIQVKHIVFERVSIESANPIDTISPDDAVGFDFQGVNFRVKHESGRIEAPDGKVNDRLFGVRLEITVDNASGKPAPYKFDIAAVALIEVAETLDKQKRDSIVAVNGGSLIYGAIRELVTTLTSRCVVGQLVLPTMDFRDQIKPATIEAKQEATR